MGRISSQQATLTFVNIPRSGISICLGAISSELDDPGKLEATIAICLKKNWFPMCEACNTLKLVIRHSLTHQFTKCLQSKRSLLIFSLQVNIVWAKRVSANRAVGKPFTVTQLVKHRWNIYILLKIFCSWIIFAGGELHLGRDPRILDPEKTFSSNIFTTQSLLTLQIFHL